MAIKFLLKGQRFVFVPKCYVKRKCSCIYLSEAKWHLNVLKPLIMTQALRHNRGEENE